MQSIEQYEREVVGSRMQKLLSFSVIQASSSEEGFPASNLAIWNDEAK